MSGGHFPLYGHRNGSRVHTGSIVLDMNHDIGINRHTGGPVNRIMARGVGWSGIGHPAE